MTLRKKAKPAPELDPDMLKRARLLIELMLVWGVEFNFLVSVIEQEKNRG